MKLIPRSPVRQLIQIPYIHPQEKPELRRLPDRREIPIRLELIRRLMVVLAVVFGVRLLAPVVRLAGELRRVAH